jgi:hypothetical protein
MDYTRQDRQRQIESTEGSSTGVVLVDVKRIEVVVYEEGELRRLALNTLIVLSNFCTRGRIQVEETARKLVSLDFGDNTHNSSANSRRNS